MITLMKRARRSIARYHRGDAGLLSVEAALTFPVLFMGLIISFSYFAAFEAKTRANKSAYTLSDYVTRQTEAVTPDFIDGLADIYRFLNNDGDVSIRVSAVKWTEVDGEGKYVLSWSDAEGDFEPLSEATLGEVEPRLPIMSKGAEVVVVETKRFWNAPIKAGLGEMEFYDFVTTMPRFATQVPFEDPAQSS